MAFEQNDINQMITLSRNNIGVLFGAICIAGMNVTTDMMSDMLHDPDLVRQEGIPNMKKLIEMAIDQVVVIFPDMVCDGEEFDEELKIREGEKPIEMLIRGFMTQILKQRPDLARLQYQPR